MNDQRALITYGDHQQEEQEDDEQNIRDIHALTPPHPPPPAANNRVGRRREAWETSSPRSSSLSITSTADLGSASSNENFTTMSREFSALVMAGSAVGTGAGGDHAENNLAMIGEHEAPMPEEETNPLAIVTDNNPLNETYPSSGSHATRMSTTSSSLTSINSQGEVSMHRVKKEEVESKISAWQNAKIAKINNRFKREDAVINGWEGEQVQKSTSWMKKVERKLEEKRARALEKMQNEVAKAHRKAEEKRASAEAKRGTKVSRVLDIANLMRAVGRPPVKRSFF